jgi:hypothetical protein
MSYSEFHLIHANIALCLAPLDDPVMADFIKQADEIDALAHQSPGFIAQPTPPDEGAVYTGLYLLNLSIWESVESLKRFTYRGRHSQALERRAEWFVQRPAPNYVLFWLPAGELPSEAAVKQRIDHLAAHGPTPFAFNFDQPYTMEEIDK